MNCKYEQVANMQIVWKYREGHMTDIILDSVIDSVKLLPFLFLTYLWSGWNTRPVLLPETGSVQQENWDLSGADFWG